MHLDIELAPGWAIALAGQSLHWLELDGSTNWFGLHPTQFPVFGSLAIDGGQIHFSNEVAPVEVVVWGVGQAVQLPIPMPYLEEI